MGLFKKKCESCKEKIDRGEEVFRKAKDPLFVEKKVKAFCCEGCVNAYENKFSNCCRGGGGCCG